MYLADCTSPRPLPRRRVITRAAVCALLLAALVAAGTGPTGYAASRPATGAKQYYVAAGGISGGPCSKSQPCDSAAHAVYLANHIAYDLTPVVINVGAGTFITHLTFPDQSYPEKSITITGASESGTKLSGSGSGPILVTFSDAPPITVTDLTMTRGSAAANTGGGAVHDGGNIMTLSNVLALHNTDAVTPETGGAVDDDGGVMTITRSTFQANSAGTPTTMGSGGAVSEEGGSLSISNSFITGNTVESAGQGGAIAINNGQLRLEGSTVTANSAPGSGTGGAISLESGRATVIGSTVNGNTSGSVGGLIARTGDATVKLGGNILLGNLGSGGSACSGGGIGDLGYNVIDGAGCSMGPKSKIAMVSSVGLLAPAGNGGPTKTERIRSASAARLMVPKGAVVAGAVFCSAMDQRGVPRQQGRASRCDAGAYQFAPPVISNVSPKNGTPGTPITITGYGFDFLSLAVRGAHPGFMVSGFVKIHLIAPAIPEGRATIKLTNADGTASAPFQMLK